MEAGTEKRYQEFISASKEVDDLYHMLALKFQPFRQRHVDTVHYEGGKQRTDPVGNCPGDVYEPADGKFCHQKPGKTGISALGSGFRGTEETRPFAFTEEGEAFVKRTVDRVLSLEHQVFENLEVEEQEQITQILRKYTRLMREGAEKI